MVTATDVSHNVQLIMYFKTVSSNLFLKVNEFW